MAQVHLHRYLLGAKKSLSLYPVTMARNVTKKKNHAQGSVLTLGLAAFLLLTTTLLQAQTCMEDGGQQICSLPAVTYNLCDYVPSTSCSDAIAWCKARGGAWVAQYGCNGPPPHCEGDHPLTDSNLAEVAENFYVYKQISVCPYIKTDTGWGATWEDGRICHSVGPKFVDGVEVQNGRIFEFHSMTRDLDGNCTLPYIDPPSRMIGRLDRRTCPAGYRAILSGNTTVACYRENDQTCPIGNPVRPGQGGKVLTETDIHMAGSPLSFTRHYDSHGFFSVGGSNDRSRPLLGPNWRTTYERQVFAVEGSAYVSAIAWRQDGSLKYFDANGTERQHDRWARETLVRDGTGWRYTTREDAVERYDADGRLQSITGRDGRTQTLEYDPTTRKLARVRDESGRWLIFEYDFDSLVAVRDSSGAAVFYEHNSNDDLVGVRPESSTVARKYAYAGTFHLLTRIWDENGNDYAAYTYDGNRVTATVHAPQLAGGTIEKTTYTYAYSGDMTTVVTPLGQTLRYRTVVTGDGARRLVSVDAPCASCGVAAKQYEYDANGYLSATTDFNGRRTEYVYNARGLEIARIEAANDTSATSAKRTIQTDWHPTFRVPVERRIVNASGVLETKTQWAYNAHGQTLAHCEINPADPAALAYSCSATMSPPTAVRRWTYRYCEATDIAAGTCPLPGLLLSADGPRTSVEPGMNGVNDVTTYTYRQNSDSGCDNGGACAYRRGDLWKVTNGLGQATEALQLDGAGRITSQRDVNGTLTDYVYHPRGWLTERIVRVNSNGTPHAGDAVTRIEYDAIGQVRKLTAPDGDWLAYSYDAAHRLTKVTDALGNSIDYCPGGLGSTDCLDAAGNRKIETISDPSGVLRYRLRRAFNQLGQLIQVLNAQDQIVRTHAYDDNSNLIRIVDGLDFVTEQYYDPLNRLVRILQNAGGIDPATTNTETRFVYDSRDNLRQVIDPDGLSTNYTYNGLNQLTTLTSPDTGNAGYIMDAAGNWVSQTDARGVTTTYTYDALNRLTAIRYPTAGLNVGFAYDQSNAVTGCTESYPLGRLTTMTDAAGSTTYCYDRRGNVTKKTRISGTAVLTTAYAYTKGDRLTSITYPGGGTVFYSRDPMGRTAGLEWSANGGGGSGTPALSGGTPTLADTIIRKATYAPFGPLTELTFGNGRTLSKTYDLNYAIRRIASPAAGGLSLDFGVDVRGDIIQVGPLLASAVQLRAYGYDALSRLTKVEDGNNALWESFTYSRTGDRLTSTQKSGTTIYTYQADSHRLAVVGGIVRNTDGNGNTTAIAGEPFIYDDRNRLVQVGSGFSGASYLYNGRGERVIKVAGLTTHYVYDEMGHLLGEYTEQTLIGGGTQLVPVAQYLWLDNVPVAVIKDKPYYLETDHLNTPRQVIDPARKGTIWKWPLTNSAFGADAPETDPDGDGVEFTFNLRFPGQYFDVETGLHYNYFRDYEPQTGRYIESDPIGLAGGFNTYTYAIVSPTNNTDELGLYGAGYAFSCFKKPSSDLMAYAQAQAAKSKLTVWPAPKKPESDSLMESDFDPLPNGNLQPGFTPQDWVCSDGAAPLTYTPRGGCCVVHDFCYMVFKCNSTSWGGSLSSPCQYMCNLPAVECFLRPTLF